MEQNVDTEDDRHEIFKVAKQVRMYQRDVTRANYFQDSEENLNFESADVVERWKEYCENLSNGENSNNREEIPAVQGPLEEISHHEVKIVLEWKRCLSIRGNN